jgi:hypothetical protein
MPLFVLEVQTGGADRDAATSAIDRIADAATPIGGELLDATVTGDNQRAYVVISAADADVPAQAAKATGLQYSGPDPVRLVGQTEDEVRAHRGDARYLVEWDLPAELTMDTYLQRKKEKSPLYAQVPEVRFLRTYVREDMSKCMCLYDATCEADVRRAREAVSTPISRLHELGGAPERTHAG